MLYARDARQQRAHDRADAQQSKIARRARSKPASQSPPISRRPRAPHVILIATPAQNLRAGGHGAGASHLQTARPSIACAKGIEHGTHKFMTEVIAEAAPHALPAILSGPSFADRRRARAADRRDAGRDSDAALREALVQALGSPTFRPYHSTDVRGVEIGGAAKNVLAIAAGIVEGRKLGASALAALTTRGFANWRGSAGLWRAQRNHGTACPASAI